MPGSGTDFLDVPPLVQTCVSPGCTTATYPQVCPCSAWQVTLSGVGEAGPAPELALAALPVVLGTSQGCTGSSPGAQSLTSSWSMTLTGQALVSGDARCSCVYHSTFFLAF